MTDDCQSQDEAPAETNIGLKQSRELAENMDHWLDLFDLELCDQELPLSQRPLRALMMLFREGAISIKAGDQRIDDPENLSHSVDELWFRVLFDAVEYW